MQYTQLERPEIRLVGICVRTNNKTEHKKLDGKIFPCVKRYFHEALAEKIAHRKNPGTTLCAYTDYANDEHGDYTYFIGEEVTHFDHLPKDFQTLIIPRQTYAKFTTKPAPMPEVLSNAWGAIWKMSQKELGGKRTYETDFEVYDERAADHQNIVLDLYVGISD
jgi:predicted transcriptional regulator YdeE